MKNNLKIKKYEIGNETAICELFETVYKTPLSLENWYWRFKNSPSGKGLISLVFDENILASHYAVTPVKFSIESNDCYTALSGTTMTNPDYRGQGLFPILAEDVYASMRSKEMKMVWGFPNTMSHRTFIKNLSWIDIYEIPFFRLKLSSLKLVPEENNNITELVEFDDSFNNLWEKAKVNFPIIALRNKDQLNWRYVNNPYEDYSIIAYHEDNQLIGYAVYKQYENELQIVDILTSESTPDIGLALVYEIVRLASEKKLHAVSMWLNVSTPLHRELEKYGFMNDAPVTYFGAMVTDEGVSKNLIYDYSNWYVTMGDSDVF